LWPWTAGSIRHKATDAMLYAFDLLEFNGKDLWPLPLGDRKAKLARLLSRAPAGIVFNEHTEEDGTEVFRHACKLGLEGIVSKHARRGGLRLHHRGRQPVSVLPSGELGEGRGRLHRRIVNGRCDGPKQRAIRILAACRT
jgi:ATP dependent DNA ligase domain